MPFNPAEYGSDWPEYSYNLVFRRARRRCECCGECGRGEAHLAGDGRCRNRHGEKRWRGKPWQRPVILSAMHLDPDADPADRSAVIVGCEPCHLALDAQRHAESRRRNREEQLGLVPFPGLELV